MNNNSPTDNKVVPSHYLIPFILVTLCFALWGFANDITNPMVKAFSKIFRMSVTEGALVQVAFYGGYFFMAFPAAMFIRKFSYKSGVLMGLGLYATGALLFFPAKMVGVDSHSLRLPAIPIFSRWEAKRLLPAVSIWRNASILAAVSLVCMLP